MRELRPQTLRRARKHASCTQFGAIPWRLHAGRVQVLLITSRKRGRWIVPKGWPIDGLTPPGSAAREAWEEAGVRGRVAPLCQGVFALQKKSTPRMIALFALQVSTLAATWPEKGQRKRRWFDRDEAAERVDNPELAAILRQFSPFG